MAGKPIEIQVITDVDSSDLEKLPDALEDVDKALEDVSDAGKDAQKDLEKSFESVEDKSKRLGKELDRDLTQALEEVGKEATTTGRKIGRELDDGFDKASRGADEFKDEAKSTAREGAASFTGEFEDVGDIIQETLANALGGFGPLGAAAGMAMAAGVGIVISKLQEIADKAAEAKESAIDLAGAFRDAGADWSSVDLADRLWETMNKITNDKKWFEVWQKEPETFFEDIIGDVEKAGVATDKFFEGMIGGTDELKEAQEYYREEMERVNAEIDAYGDSNVPQALVDERNALQGLNTEIDSEIKKRGYAEKAVEGYKDAVGDAIPTLEEQADAVERSNDALQTNANLLLGARGAQREWVSTLEEVNAEIAVNGQNLDINTEAGRANQESLDNLAEAGWNNLEAMQANGASHEDLYAATQQTRQGFIDAATAAGMEAGEAEALANELGLIPGSVQTKITADNSQAMSAAQTAASKFQELRRTDVNVPIRLGINSAAWQAQVNAAAARIWMPPINTSINISTRVI